MSVSELSTQSLETEQQIQRAIQTLRLRTQESLASSNDEIARLEEENELKQMRLAEIEAEIKELEAGARDQGRQSPRRWPLGFVVRGIESKSDHQVRKDEEPLDDDTDSSVSRKFSSFMSISESATKYFGKAKGKDESVVTDRLHEAEEENKKIVEQLESDLRFKQEQVTALELALEEQDNIVSNLQKDIFQLHEDSPEKGDFTDIEVEEMEEKILKLADEERELLIQIRLIKRIQDMEEEEQKISVSELKRERVDTSVRLKALKQDFESNKEIIEHDTHACRWDWALLGIKLALAQRVSLKQIRRLQRKAGRGESDELKELIERATRALEEELMMRENLSSDSQNVGWKDVAHLEEAVTATLSCCRSYIVGVELLQSETPVSVMTSILETLSNMKEYLEVLQASISVASSVAAKLLVSFSQDQALVPDDLQAAFEDEYQSAEEIDESSFCESLDKEEILSRGVGDPNESDVLDKLQIGKEELCTKIEVVKEDLVALQERGEIEKEKWTMKLTKLKKRYNEEGSQWEQKDKEVERALKEAEEAKVAEDMVREFLELTVRSKLKEKGEELL
mmetsp:Transcript_13303/g.20652  ORF Transcript_13303/g.20652 Transcript_13303/m.20652 type:complete len:570 (-) Transcript_13303:130-1839(-)